MTTAPGPFYFAWADETETTFGVEHQVEDEQIVTFRLEHTEGNCATLTLDVRNPRIGLLNPGRKVWAWFSYDSGTGGVVPLIFARLVGVPTNLIAEVVTLAFIAKPLNFITQKFMLAEELKIRPYYDPIFIAEEKRPVFSTAGSTGDADVVLAEANRLTQRGEYDAAIKHLLETLHLSELVAAEVLAQRDGGLHTREVVPETEMGSGAEREMLGETGSVQPELGGAVVHRFVAVRGGDSHRDAVAR
jgi:hypothetical protein